MKKIISAVLASAMLLPCANAFAEETASKEPKLIYNNAEITGEGSAPFITDGRTMLPFRYFLEAIDASVDYDDATRMVKATKDGITVSFSLDDTYLDISKSDAEPKRVVQDTANVIKDDRVYVPIRFMSEAFGLNVGWDNTEKTAIVVDIPAYIADLKEKAPVLTQYMEISSTIPESYTTTFDMTFDFSSNIPEAENINLNFALNTEASVNKDAASADASASLDTNLIKMLSGIDISKLENVQFSFLYKDSVFYVKTDLVEKLKEIIPTNEKLKTVSAIVNKDKWFSADITKLFRALGLPTEYIDLMKSALKGGTNDPSEILENAIPANSIRSVADAASIDLAFEIYSKLFPKMMTITDNGDGNYEVKYSLAKDEFKNMLLEIDPEMAENPEDAKMLESMAFDLAGSTTIENNVATKSDITLSYGADGAVMNMTINSTLTPDTNKEITVPASTIDLINIITILK